MNIDFHATEREGKAKKAMPVRVKPLDLEPAKKRLAVYDAEIDKMVAQAQGIEVIDDKSNEAAVLLGTQAKKLNNKIEDIRKQIVADPNEFVKSVNGFARGFQERLKTIEAGLKKKIGDYQYNRELERREAERKAREEAEKLQAKLDEEAKEKGVEPVTVTPPVMPAPSMVTRTESGQSHQRMEWTFEILDDSQVPRDYLVVDEQKIRRAVKMGVREIPGVKIFERPITAFRT